MQTVWYKKKPLENTGLADNPYNYCCQNPISQIRLAWGVYHEKAFTVQQKKYSLPLKANSTLRTNGSVEIYGRFLGEELWSTEVKMKLFDVALLPEGQAS